MAQNLLYKKWHLIAIVFPKYLDDQQVSHNGVITEIAEDLTEFVNSLGIFLNDLEEISHLWDSRSPNLADVILKNLEGILKCFPFLKHIETHRQKLQKMLCDETFAAATAQFEKDRLNDPSVFICTTFDNLIKPVTQSPENTGIKISKEP
uniref:Uncharacterized protein n=1 Tax=Panagrolaimus superbus TaxID=310955 RepID=A0A914YBU1_9BILA